MKWFYSRAKTNTALSNEDNEAQERRLNAVFAAGDMASEPSTALEKRVTELAAQRVKHEARLHKCRTVVRRGFTLAGAMAVLFVGLKIWPVLTMELFMRRAEAATGAAHSAHIVVWRIADDGSRIKESESWQQNGLWREARMEMGRNTVSLFDGTSQWNYEPAFNKVTVYRKDGPYGRGKPEPAEITGTALLREFTGNGFSKDLPRVTTVDTTVDGRAARQVRIQTTDHDIETKDITLWVERATDLPIRAEMNVSAYSGGHAKMIAEFSFNEALPAHLFKPDFPKSARLIDHDKGKEEWRERLASGIARKEVGDRTIVIRDLQVNAEGDVFLFYTAGKRPEDAFQVNNPIHFAGRDWHIEMSDEFGTKYVWQGTFMSRGRDKNSLEPPKGYTFNGERGEGDLWIPLTPQSPWKPRHFTLTFHVNSVNLHGKFDEPARRVDYSQTATFTFPVEQPATALVPDYTLFTDPELERTVLSLRANERGLLPPGVEPSPQLVRTLTGNKDSVSSLDFSPDGRTLASDGWLNSMKIWDVATGKVQQDFNNPEEFMGIIEFSPDGKNLVSRNAMWDVTKKTSLWPLTPPDGEGASPRSLTLSRDGKVVMGVGKLPAILGMEQGQQVVKEANAWAKLWDARTGKLLQTRILPHDGSIRWQLATAAPETSSGVWKVVTTQDKRDGKKFLGGIVRLWDARTGVLLRTLEGTEGFSAAVVALSADGQTIAVAGNVVEDGTTRGDKFEMRLYDADSGAWVRSMRGRVSHINALIFSPDGTLLASPDTQAKTIKLWDAQSGKPLEDLVGHGATLRTVTFSPDSKMLASGDNAGNIILWRVR